MTPAWRSSVCRAASASVIADSSKYAQPVPHAAVAPIDTYYAASIALLKAADSAYLSAHPSIGPLALVGTVSATENYLRDVLARIIALCPIAQDAAASQSISLGTVIWHSGVLPERGAFEHLSFAGADNTRLTIRKFIGYELKKNGPTEAMLAEFDKVCELRHGIVHSGGIIAGKNALRLQLKRGACGLCTRVTFAELQECADVCTTFVVALNTELFACLAERWATAWRRRATWEPRRANSLFVELWRTFSSATDSRTGQIADPVSLVRCRNAVKQEYNVR